MENDWRTLSQIELARHHYLGTPINKIHRSTLPVDRLSLTTHKIVPVDSRTVSLCSFLQSLTSFHHACFHEFPPRRSGQPRA